MSNSHADMTTISHTSSTEYARRFHRTSSATRLSDQTAPVTIGSIGV